MTIRDELLKKNHRMFLASVATWIVIVVGMYLSTSDYSAIILVIGVTGFVAVILSSLWYIRCPRCYTNLSQITTVYRKNKINYCPNCGVSFDEDL